ncbi:MAG: hypothetical protein RLZZ612_2157 [Pseudomonadota bacterium]
MPQTTPSQARTEPESPSAFRQQLHRVYGWYAGGFAVFVVGLALLEQMGLARHWIGYIFLIATVLLYASIGIMSRTNNATEYYVAGRRVPAIYNGMATGADWMSAASFISLAGTLYLTGYAGLAFVMGWTGGYCLVALFLAPYLRKFGQFTIPDFLGDRFGGHWPRLLGVLATLLCSFTYVVAQIYGVGLITTRLTGVAFELGIFLGLGGILVCSFLGGMRAVTWTQVAQYIVLVVAYLIPVVWLSVKQTGTPVPTAVYGYQLEKITAREHQLLNDPKEQEVIAAFKAKADAYADKLKDVPTALATEREAAKQHVLALKAAQAPTTEIAQAEKTLASLPRNVEAAQQRWTHAQASYAAKAQPLANMPRHEQAFAGDPNGLPEAREAFETSRNNFLALVFCLTVGTAALPHILTRTYTTPSVRQARHSVTWTLLFIAVLYFTAPALAVMVKYEVLHALVGTPFSQLPIWIKQWAAVEPNLLSITDINHDGIVQLGEMHIGTDIIVLATPEIAGLPYVISGMVAAGGLAAALSTADGLLLTIASALSHDVYFKMIDPKARTSQQVMLSKMLLLLVALAAAYVAVQKPADILFLVSAAFSFAAAALFPVLTLGIFWQRANKWGAIAGMVGGLGITIYYMAVTQPWLRSLFGVVTPVELWWGIQPISAGIFGVPVGFLLVIVVSLLTPPPDERTRELVEHIRYPRLFKD